MNAIARGDYGERLAQAYLERRGYRLLAKNYRAGRHEIDLVMRDGAYTVFVKVKARASTAYGMPGEAVSAAKRRFLTIAAQSYLAEHALLDSPARFDVIEVYLRNDEIRHIENAF